MHDRRPSAVSSKPVIAATPASAITRPSTVSDRTRSSSDVGASSAIHSGPVEARTVAVAALVPGSAERLEDLHAGAADDAEGGHAHEVGARDGAQRGRAEDQGEQHARDQQAQCGEGERSEAVEGELGRGQRAAPHQVQRDERREREPALGTASKRVPNASTKPAPLDGSIAGGSWCSRRRGGGHNKVRGLSGSTTGTLRGAADHRPRSHRLRLDNSSIPSLSSRDVAAERAAIDERVAARPCSMPSHKPSSSSAIPTRSSGRSTAPGSPSPGANIAPPSPMSRSVWPRSASSQGQFGLVLSRNRPEAMIADLGIQHARASRSSSTTRSRPSRPRI